MKKKHRVVMSETIVYSYDVEAENEEEARDVIYSGDYDLDTYKVYDSFNIQIDDVYGFDADGNMEMTNE
jgi:hypothetical protein